MLPIPSARELTDGTDSPAELAVRKTNAAVKSARQVAEEYSEFTQEMTKATVAGLTGAVNWDVSPGEKPAAFIGNARVGPIVSHPSRSSIVAKALGDYELAKSTEGGAAWDRLSKEWTLGTGTTGATPINTGLVPFDLEAPAKLLTPRPTPLRNSIPRVKAQGGARRIKVISGFTGTGTGNQTTLQSGISESTGNAGPGGLSYYRGPYIGYSGYDYIVNYVTTSLSDSVSWQAEYAGQGFEDIRSLSNTALLYATMLIDERLMLYGRGTTANGYTGSLGTPTITAASVSASLAPGGQSSLGTGTYAVVVAADAGDLLGTTGGMHIGPVSAVASVHIGAANEAIQVSITTDVAGALGYNLFLCNASVSGTGASVWYQGRTGYNVGYITTFNQTSSTPWTTVSATDASQSSYNYDGFLTNVAASGGYVNRLNAPFSTTNPGAEFQTAFGSLYEAVKGDPDEIWLNGFDRLQLSNTIIQNGTNSGAYHIYVQQNELGNIKAGTVVTSLLNEVTGSEVPLTVHPWMPQGNVLIRQKTLPIPDSNVAETSYMAMVQDYVAVQWPVVQFTYDASTFEIGTMAHVAPSWNALLQGVQGVGIGTTPPSYGDS